MSTENGSSGGSGSSSSSSRERRRAPVPRSQSEAPRGAFLGSSSDGSRKLVSRGDGTASWVDANFGIDADNDDNSGSNAPLSNNVVELPKSQPKPSAAPRTSIAGSSISSGQATITSGGSPVPTTVNQKPPENGGGGGGGGSGDGPESTTTNQSPRSDSSVVLAGLQGLRRSRSPFLSNNFVTFVGRAGGLGRRTSASKRTLIGGA